MNYNGTIDEFQGSYRFLSNFTLAEVEFDGDIYPSVEHAYQAAKTESTLERDTIRQVATALEAKRLGKHVTIRQDWDKIKDSVMLYLVHQKFQHEELQQKLERTGRATIKEGNYWNDRYWGVCNGEGLNKLGKILMLVRALNRAFHQEED